MNRTTHSPWRHVRLSQNHMATTFVLTVSCEESRVVSAEQVLRECHQLISRLEAELSEFLPVSGVYQLNQAPVHTRVKLAESAIECLTRAKAIRDLTRGNFSALIKSSETNPRIGWHVEKKEAWRLSPGTRLSFGAIGKGFALDQIRTLVEREGFHDYILDAGGSSLILSGFAAPGTPWEWGWSWSYNEKKEPLGISFSHSTGLCVGLGISGTHEKGEHLLSPQGKEGGYQSALIGHPYATEADALSTALFVGGWEETLAMFKEIPEPVAAAVIDKDGVPSWNGRFQWFWGSPAVKAVLALCASTTALAEETVDLSGLGLDDFTPYVFERNDWWILLPLLSLILVFWHLKRPPRKRTEKKT